MMSVVFSTELKLSALIFKEVYKHMCGPVSSAVVYYLKAEQL